MVYTSEFTRPTGYYSRANRSRSSSLSRYSSPVRSSHVSSSRASTPQEIYGIPALRNILQDSFDSTYSSRRSSLSSTNSSSRRSSISKEFPPETAEFLHNGSRDSYSSLGTIGSSRRSSVSNNFPAPEEKHVHFQEVKKETETKTTKISDRGCLNLESKQGINWKRDQSSQMPSFNDNSDAMGKLTVRERYPSASSDAYRRQRARAAYWSALDDTDIIIKNRDLM